MTIAGGMVCSDGILVYADTEWTAATLKIQRAKHWYLVDTSGRLKCVIAGAGDEDHLRLAIQTFWAAILQMNGSKLRTHDVRDALQTALNDVYNNYIYRDPRGARKDFGIIMGVSTPEDPPLLFKTSGTGILLADSYEYVYLGSGTDMAMYLSSRLEVTGISTDVGRYVASFVLWEVKRHVPTCGGDTVIYRLLNDGSMNYSAEGDLWDSEQYFAATDRKVQRIRVHTANLESSDEEFEKKLTDFCDDLRALRKTRQVKLQAEKGLSL
jgi:hypothetical protein